jgi:hypothetical protein
MYFGLVSGRCASLLALQVVVRTWLVQALDRYGPAKGCQSVGELLAFRSPRTPGTHS